MSRDKYKYYWFPAVMDAIKNYNRLLATSRREWEIRQAIDKTIAGFSKSADGAIAVQIVRETLIDGNSSMKEAAEIAGTTERNAKNLRTRFILAVGHRIGY